MNRFRYVACGVSLVVALLTCFGVFLLPLPSTVSEVPSALVMMDLSRADQETTGDSNPLDEINLVAPAEEAEGADKDPAELLTMLLLTVCCGVSVGWLLRNAQRQGGSCSLAVVGRSLATAGEDLPFSGVFRL